MSSIGSPPRGALGSRKPSIVERASSAIDKLSSGSGLRRAATTPSQGSNWSTAASSRDVLNGVENAAPDNAEVYSMNVEDYDIGSAIGYGSSAVVYIATYKPLNKPVAIKMIDLDMFERNQIDELRREIQIMSLSKHPNLLPVHGSFVNGSKLYIVAPFCSAGSCLDIMKTAFQDGIDEVSIATILKQALEGLVYLHKNGLIHRDVKAGNLLIHEGGLVQLADFGVSSSLMETGERKGLRKTFVGTPCWMAPEVMEQSGYDYKADIWSFGITALELATGHAPFAKFPPIKVLMLTLQNDPPTLDRDATKFKYSKTFKEMIDMCLQKDPAKRPTAEKLLSHAFFKQAAKKREYLVKVLLQNLPPITQRSHNKKTREQKDGSYHKGISWDFGGDDGVFEVVNNTDTNLQNFLVDTPSQSSLDTSNSDEHPQNGIKGVKFAPMVAVAGQGVEPLNPAARKSRFILGDSPGASPSVSTANLSGADSATDSPNSNTGTPAGPSPLTGGVRKGRFSVNQSSPSVLSPSPSGLALSGPTASPNEPLPKVDEIPTAPLERKTSRFAVQTLPSSNSTTSPSAAGLVSTPTTGSQDSVQPPSTRTRGRFEVTTGDKLSSSSSNLTVQERLERAEKQNELLRAILGDVVNKLKDSGGLETIGIVLPPGLLEDGNLTDARKVESPGIAPTRSASTGSDNFQLDQPRPQSPPT